MSSKLLLKKVKRCVESWMFNNSKYLTIHVAWLSNLRIVAEELVMYDLALNCQTVSTGTHCLHSIDVMHLIGNSFWVSKWWLVTMWLWESHCAKSEVRNTSMPFTLKLSSRVSHTIYCTVVCPFEVRDFMLLGKRPERRSAFGEHRWPFSTEVCCRPL